MNFFQLLIKENGEPKFLTQVPLNILENKPNCPIFCSLPIAMYDPNHFSVAFGVVNNDLSSFQPCENMQLASFKIPCLISYFPREYDGNEVILHQFVAQTTVAQSISPPEAVVFGIANQPSALIPPPMGVIEECDEEESVSVASARTMTANTPYRTVKNSKSPPSKAIISLTQDQNINSILKSKNNSEASSISVQSAKNLNSKLIIQDNPPSNKNGRNIKNENDIYVMSSDTVEENPPVASISAASCVTIDPPTIINSLKCTTTNAFVHNSNVENCEDKLDYELKALLEGPLSEDEVPPSHIRRSQSVSSFSHNNNNNNYTNNNTTTTNNNFHQTTLIHNASGMLVVDRVSELGEEEDEKKDILNDFFSYSSSSVNSISNKINDTTAVSQSHENISKKKIASNASPDVSSKIPITKSNLSQSKQPLVQNHPTPTSHQQPQITHRQTSNTSRSSPFRKETNYHNNSANINSSRTTHQSPSSQRSLIGGANSISGAANNRQKLTTSTSNPAINSSAISNTNNSNVANKLHPPSSNTSNNNGREAGPAAGLVNNTNTSISALLNAAISNNSNGAVPNFDILSIPPRQWPVSVWTSLRKRLRTAQVSEANIAILKDKLSREKLKAKRTQERAEREVERRLKLEAVKLDLEVGQSDKISEMKARIQDLEDEISQERLKSSKLRSAKNALSLKVSTLSISSNNVNEANGNKPFDDQDLKSMRASIIQFEKECQRRVKIEEEKCEKIRAELDMFKKEQQSMIEETRSLKQLVRKLEIDLVNTQSLVPYKFSELANSTHMNMAQSQVITDHSATLAASPSAGYLPYVSFNAHPLAVSSSSAKQGSANNNAPQNQNAFSHATQSHKNKISTLTRSPIPQPMFEDQHKSETHFRVAPVDSSALSSGPRGSNVSMEDVDVSSSSQMNNNTPLAMPMPSTVHYHQSLQQQQQQQHIMKGGTSMMTNYISHSSPSMKGKIPSSPNEQKKMISDRMMTGAVLLPPPAHTML